MNNIPRDNYTHIQCSENLKSRSQHLAFHKQTGICILINEIQFRNSNAEFAYIT
jgi:hypothetical protein